MGYKIGTSGCSGVALIFLFGFSPPLANVLNIISVCKKDPFQTNPGINRLKNNGVGYDY